MAEITTAARRIVRALNAEAWTHDNPALQRRYYFDRAGTVVSVRLAQNVSPLDDDERAAYIVCTTDHRYTQREVQQRLDEQSSEEA